jgi:hypothetical protein
VEKAAVIRSDEESKDGVFAAFEVEVNLSQFPEASIACYGRFNPSGSRNLEFDPKKVVKR